jgi:hypothetical protein
MANSLLDFVMSVVRDPDVAARYAADPSQTIADAHLTDVTSVDVNNLIPMVSDSLSMAAPAVGGDAAGDGNVWTSGAATAAFDAFSVPIPDHTVDVHDAATGVIDQPLDQTVRSAADVPQDLHQGIDTFDPSTQFSAVDGVQAPVDDGGFGVDDHVAWDHSVVDHHPTDADPAGFDIFE